MATKIILQYLNDHQLVFAITKTLYSGHTTAAIIGQ